MKRLDFGFRRKNDLEPKRTFQQPLELAPLEEIGPVLGGVRILDKLQVIALRVQRIEGEDPRLDLYTSTG